MLRFELTIEGDWREFTKRTFGRGIEAANHAMGKFWKSRLLKKHFTLAASSEYGYRLRTYDDATGFRRPLVDSGKLKRMALGSGLIRGTSKKMVVQFNVPNYALFRKRNGPDMVRELTAISKGDMAAMVKVFDRALERFLERAPKRKRRIRSGVS